MPDRTQRKATARAEREAAQAAAVLRASRRRRAVLTLSVVGGLTAAGAVGFAVISGTPTARPHGERAAVRLPAQQTTDLRTAVKAAHARTTSYDRAYGNGTHVTSAVHYPQNPPTNGPHHPQWAADGNYVGRATPQTEMLVHALEHGRIEIQYRPGLPAAQVAQLEALYREDPAHVLLFENATDMDCDVAVTAWGHGVLCDTFSPAVVDAVRTFRDRYRDHGPEYVM
jgi:hypothetical protein